MFAGKGKLEFRLGVLGTVLIGLGICNVHLFKMECLVLHLVLLILPIGLLSFASGMALLSKTLVISRPKILMGSIAMSLLVLGEVLCRFIMLGWMVGFPLASVGIILCSLFALSLGNHQIGALKKAVGIVLVLLGLVTLLVSNYWTAFTVGDIMLARQREMSFALTAYQWLLPFCWLAAASLIMVGIKQRSDWGSKTYLVLWFYWFAYFLLTIIGVVIVTWAGGPLSA